MFALLALVAALHLTAKDNNKSFTVEPSQAIVVTLASNRSTGYHWKFVKVAGESSVIKLVSHRYVQPKGPPGTPGKEIWRFTAESAMTSTHLRLQYVGPSSTKPAQRFNVTIHVS